MFFCKTCFFLFAFLLQMFCFFATNVSLFCYKCFARYRAIFWLKKYHTTVRTFIYFLNLLMVHSNYEWKHKSYYGTGSVIYKIDRRTEKDLCAIAQYGTVRYVLYNYSYISYEYNIISSLQFRQCDKK